ncbi:MAG: HAMP domain-containing protein [Nitrospirae bacterium]|nr:HAMP domain-containing protein [Nitrospirota bacterium]
MSNFRTAFLAIALTHAIFFVCEMAGFGGFFLISIHHTGLQSRLVGINFIAVLFLQVGAVLPLIYRQMKRGWAKATPGTPEGREALRQVLVLPWFGTGISFALWYGVGAVFLFFQIALGGMGWVDAIIVSGAYILSTSAFHIDRLLLWRYLLRRRVETLQGPNDFIACFRLTVLEKLFASAAFLGFVAITLSYFYALRLIVMTPEQMRVAYTFSIPVVVFYPVFVIGFTLLRLNPVLEYMKHEVEGLPHKEKNLRQARLVALRFPYELAAVILLLWTGAGMFFVPVQVFFLDMPLRKAFVLFAGLIPTALGVGLYQANWHRRILKPFIAHLSERHPEIVGTVRALSLRWKLMASFLALTVFTVSLAYLASTLQSIQALDPGLLIVFFAVLLLVAVGVVVYWSDDISQPLVELAQTASDIGTGDLTRRVSVGEEDEIGRLAMAFNRMEAALREKMESIRSLNLDLDNKVKERTRELEQTLSELKHAQAQVIHSEKMASLGQLVAGVAHELNNPLSFVYSNVKLLQELVDRLKRAGAAPDLIDRMERLLKGMDEGADRARKIVGDLKTFSRLDEAEWKRVDIHEGLESSLNLIHNKMKKNIQIHRELDTLPKIGCYASELNQVFLNLLVNAVDAISERGDLWLRTRRKDGSVEIEIEDNGAGMPPEVQKKIFEPFYTTKPVGRGTGLGLSISYNIVQKHGGSIRVDSSPGRGTKFTISLPVREIPLT